MKRQFLLAVALGLCCLTAGAFAQQYKKYKEVPGIEKAEDGTRFIMNGEGVKYTVWKDGGSGNVYFIHSETNMPQWHDPRGPEPTRMDQTIEMTMPMDEVPAPKASSLSVAITVALPILLFVGGTFARIAYLQIHYPELLWPTKERRDRRKAAGGKIKTPKARGKMNQDGRGGRSNNT